MPHGMTSVDETELAELKKARDERDELKEQVKNLRAALETVAPKPPEGFSEMLSPMYGTVVFDKGCREPIGWGFRITRELNDEEAEAMKKHGDIDWIGDGEYALVVRWITPAEAEAKYGKPHDLKFGPRGGFNQIFYGDKAFNHRKMKP